MEYLTNPLQHEVINVWSTYDKEHPAQDIPIVVREPIKNSTTNISPSNSNLNSMLNPFFNFNYKPPVDTPQYAAEPYNSKAQLNTMRNPAAFFNMPAQQASTAINTTANINAVENSNVPSNLPANNSIPQTSAQSQNSIESVLTDIQTTLDNLFKSIFGKW